MSYCFILNRDELIWLNVNFYVQVSYVDCIKEHISDTLFCLISTDLTNESR